MDTQQDRRSINELIENFRSKKSEISKQNLVQNVRTADGLEPALLEEFDRILDFSPKCMGEAVGLADFLLNMLGQLNIGSTLPDQINAKILEVVASGYARSVEKDRAN
jgi:hypothetical protein